MSERPFDLLIFDWDGTILDSIGTIVACTQLVFEELGLAVPTDRRIRSAIGLGLRETVDHIYPGCDDETFDRVRARYRRHWMGNYARRPRVIAGAREALAQLDAHGYRMAVATAKGREGLRMDFARTGLARFFDSSRTLEEAPGKPHPAMALGLLEELEVSAERALVIGDSTHDMGMAANAGVRGLGVASGAEAPENLRAARALDVLASVAVLPAWLDSWERREEAAS